MIFKEVTGITKVPTTRYFVNIGEEQEAIEVSKHVFEKVMRSLSNGDLWVYNEVKGLLKYGTQLNLFDEELEE